MAYLPHPALGWLVAAHVAGAAVVLCLCLVGKSFSAPNAQYGEAGIIYPPQVAEIVVALLAILATPLAASASVLASASLQRPFLRAILAGYVSIAMAAAAVIVMALSIEPFRTYNISYADQPDNVQQLLGGMVFALAVPLSIVCAYISVSRLWPLVGSTKQLRQAPIHPASRLWGSNGALVAYGIIALGAGFTLTCVLSSVMNYGPGSYLMATSPFSLVQGVSVSVMNSMFEGLESCYDANLAFSRHCCSMPFLVDVGLRNYYVLHAHDHPQGLRGLRRLFHERVSCLSMLVAPNPLPTSHTTSPCCCPGAAVGGIMLIGALGTYWPPARRALHSRYAASFLRTLRLKDTGDLSVGEVLLGTSLVSLRMHEWRHVQ
jgi:hypothetical protein